MFLVKDGRDPNFKEQLTTLTYKENKIWTEKLISEGYTVLDLGNPGNVQELSPFYEIEKELLFR
ncbi:MAG: hypothetical protein KBD76_16200 [Bacteriovorax sp.]|nr:hypothetical protein [Bacteriovorax sp.]